MAKIADSSTVPIDSLQLWDRNPRSIKGDRFNELKERLKRQGQIKPLLVAKDGMTVIGGNMRLRAMKELGIEEVWISQTEAETDKEIFDLALTDNEEFGYYEQEQVAELALELGLSPLELKSYALSLGEPTTLDLVIDKFGPEEVEEDEVPEVDDTTPPVSQLGEVYQLGRHRLMCGSATEAADIEILMDGKKPDCIHTDPPYGLGKRMSGGTWATESPHYKDMHTWDLVAEQEFFDVCLRMNCNVVIWGGNYFNTPPSRGWLIWKKPHFPTMADCEIAFTNMDMNARVFDSNRSDPNKEHPTQKPLKVVDWALSYLEGELVLDLFGGSGSTLIACEQTNRTCYMMELDPKYCDVIRKRYAKHIGEEESWQEATPVIKSLVVA